MLTPRFELSQDDKYLVVTIYAPFTNIDRTEVFMEGTDFRFSSPPYFLRLHLPGEVEESDAASGAWDAETTSFVVKCPKVVEGEHFPGLDMLTQLLTPKGDTSVKNVVEELNGEDFEGREEEEEEEDIEWYFEQNVPAEKENHAGGVDVLTHGYGFGFAETSAYSRLLAEFGQLLDLRDPDSLSHKEREEQRKEKEAVEFNPEHYLADLHDGDPMIEEACRWQPDTFGEKFTAEQQEQLLALPKKHYLVTRTELASVHLALADILYGHCFALRSSLGDVNTEHGWLAAKLSASLSACARFSSPSSVVRSCVRRALTYPYLRHYHLATQAWKDVVGLLKAGNIPTIQGLLALSESFTETPGFYIFNQLYLSPYCTWLQTVPPSHLSSLASAISSSLDKLSKASLGLDLEELEHAAQLTLQEEEGSRSNPIEDQLQDLTLQLGKVNVEENLDSDDDSSDETSDSDDDSEDG